MDMTINGNKFRWELRDKDIFSILCSELLFCMNEFYKLLYYLLLKYVTCQVAGDFLSWDDWFTPWLTQHASDCTEVEMPARILHATGGSWASIPFFSWGKVLQERLFGLLWGGVSDSLGFCSASPSFRLQLSEDPIALFKAWRESKVTPLMANLKAFSDWKASHGVNNLHSTYPILIT